MATVSSATFDTTAVLPVQGKRGCPLFFLSCGWLAWAYEWVMTVNRKISGRFDEERN